VDVGVTTLSRAKRTLLAVTLCVVTLAVLAVTSTTGVKAEPFVLT
jgi:hypothetical protein